MGRMDRAVARAAKKKAEEVAAKKAGPPPKHDVAKPTEELHVLEVAGRTGHRRSRSKLSEDGGEEGGDGEGKKAKKVKAEPRRSSFAERLTRTLTGSILLGRNTYSPQGLLGMAEMDALIVEIDNSCFVDRSPFLAWISVSTFLNTLLLGLQVDFMCYHNCQDSDLAIWKLIDNLFTVFGIVELILCIFFLGPADFFSIRVYEVDETSKEPPFSTHPLYINLSNILWNSISRYIPKRTVNWFRCLDFVLVAMRVFEVWIMPIIGLKPIGIKYFSAIRVLHAPRSAQRIKAIMAFRELWLILENVQETMKTVCCVVVLLSGIIWVFAVAMTILVGEQRPDTSFDFQARRSEWRKNEYWGTVPASCFTLFQVVTRDQTSETVRPVIEYEMAIGILMALFLVITWLSALSTILGAVVQSILTSARINKDKQEAERKRIETVVMNSIVEIFTEADRDHSGKLSFDELEEALLQHTVKHRLSVIEIKPSDLRLLFTLLDEDGFGDIPLQNFFRGCMRLRGDAGARDLNALHIDVNRYARWVDEADERVSNVNDILSELLNVMDKIDREVVQDPTQDHKDPVMMARRMREYIPKSESLRKKMSNETRRLYLSEESVASRKASAVSLFEGRVSSKPRPVAMEECRVVGRGPASFARKQAARSPKAGQKRIGGQAFTQQRPVSHWGVGQPDPPPVPVHILKKMQEEADSDEGL